MLRRVSPIALLLALLLGPAPVRAQTPPAAPNRPELRAFWVDGFNDGFLTPAQCDLLLARVRAAHMNAVFVQMRKRADAYYASHYEPWATDDPEHFDALEYLCRQAHAPGQPRIQVHAWINACAVGGNKGPQSLVKQHPDWLSLSDTGADYDGESTKIDPGNPAAADWTYRVYLDVVRHYDVDGIHMDFIRYGGSGKTVGHWGYNAFSVARYNVRYGTTGQPKWDDPRWRQWRRDQVTALVRRVSIAAHALKPHLIVSAATICWGDGPKNDAEYEAKSASYTEVFAPWRDWLREGLLDLNCPMTYFDLSRHPDYWRRWSDFVKDHQYGRLSAMGIGTWINAVPDSLAEIASTRQPTGRGKAAAGVVLFSYAGTDSAGGQEEQYNPAFYSSLGGPDVFAQDVSPPPMPWRDRPKIGAIMGVLLTGESITPVDGGTVMVTGPGGLKRTGMSDGNGFFALTDLPPGDYDIDIVSRVAGKIVGGGSFGGVHVRAGRVTAWSPDLDELWCRVTGIGELPEGEKVIPSRVVVTNGSDRLGDDFYIADGFGRPPLRVHAPGLIPPTVAGDIVAVAGTLHHTSGGALLDATAVRHLGAVLVP
ncbi:MAG: family 10 glycosylhydrolase [Armatimonadetes bacterium]|nr:family 10 glycosylhydrolase [Armatimonadota bacterium]